MLESSLEILYPSVMPQSDPTTDLEKSLAERILVLDGAMGTTIRTYGLKEADARGERFADSEKDLLNNGDILSLTRPEVIGDIHKRFYDAGSDICETNTFSATSIAQSEFFVEDPREKGGRKDPEFFQKIIENPFLNELAWDMNVESSRLCRKWADDIGTDTTTETGSTDVDTVDTFDTFDLRPATCDIRDTCETFDLRPSREEI